MYKRQELALIKLARPEYDDSPSAVMDRLASLENKVKNGAVTDTSSPVSYTHLDVYKRQSVDSGSYAVVLIDDEEGVIKKIVYGPNFIELHSINPMYPVRRFENENVLRIRVFGLVRSIRCV